MKLCRVIEPGLFTTVQDLGRPGFQRFGVPISGAMDQHALIVANLLLGNESRDAGLEITLLGPKLEFLDETQIAVTGADLSPTINREEVACWQTLHVSKDDVLSFGRPQSGCRAYLAVKGGIDVPVVLGSRSTYSRGGFGGFQGRKLKAGDIVEAFKPDALLKHGFRMPQQLIPHYSSKLTVEVVLGPQHSFFTDRRIETFLSSTFTVTSASDRMGYRLDGPQIKRRGSADMVSDAIPVGAVQVPRSGKPIIMMLDAQTTGGYPKIAVVTSPGISRLGQAKPGDRVQFSKISPNKARTKLLKHTRTLNQMKTHLEESEC